MDKPDYLSDAEWEESQRVDIPRPKRKANGAHRPDPTVYAPPPIDTGDAAGPHDDAPFDPDYQPPGESAEFEEVGGIAKRITTLASLNERYAILQAEGSASVYVSRADFLPIQDTDLKRRLAGEVVRTVDSKGKSSYPPAFKYWAENAHRHVYLRVVFAAGEQRPDTYNLYHGLGVVPRKGTCDKIIAHVQEVICAGNKKDGEAMLKLLAWQLQNVGKPSRVIVVMKTKKHQAGKGVLAGELMLKIYGPSGFLPSSVDQVLGRFNDSLRGRAYIFLDEVLFAGDRRSADAIKRLSTTTVYGIETKNLPIVPCPIAVNLWIASNHENAAFIEESDARYWALDVSEHRIGDHQYFAALIAEIENGGREAFAHYLLSMDVSDFVPARDVPMNNAPKQKMIQASINPFDIRKWIEACCISERVIGHNDGDGVAWPWLTGAKHPFYSLRNAYVEWQKTVRTKIGPEPTPENRIGAALTGAGFGAGHTGAVRWRTLPDPETCLRALRQENVK